MASIPSIRLKFRLRWKNSARDTRGISGWTVGRGGYSRQATWSSHTQSSYPLGCGQTLMSTIKNHVSTVAWKDNHRIVKTPLENMRFRMGSQL